MTVIFVDSEKTPDANTEFGPQSALAYANRKTCKVPFSGPFCSSLKSRYFLRKMPLVSPKIEVVNRTVIFVDSEKRPDTNSEFGPQSALAYADRKTCKVPFSGPFCT